MKELSERLRKHTLHYVILLSISVVAALLRFQLLSTHAIFFSDIGRDFLVAYQSLESEALPLVGIATSRPYLHQGPLSLWLTMVVFYFSQNSDIAVVFVFAFIGFLTVVAVYELVVTTVSNRAALVSAAVIAVSPLAVAQSRMAYHTNPISLFMVGYLWAIYYFWQKFSLKWLVVCLVFFLLLVQSELSNIPLFLLIPYVFWRRKYPVNRTLLRKIILPVTVVVFLGLLPQILSELHGNTSQLSGILSTVMHKITTLKIFPERSNFLWGPNSLLYYLKYTFGVGLLIQLMGVFLLTITGLVTVRLIRTKQLPITLELSLVALLILFASFLAIRGVSEAYMPPVFVCFAISVAAVTFSQKRVIRALCYGVVTIVVLGNSLSAWRSDFYTQPGLELSYRTIGEQRAIASYIMQHKQDNTVQLATAPSLLEYAPSYLDGIQFFLEKQGVSVQTDPDSTQRSYMILPLATELPPNAFTIQQFRTYQLLLSPARIGGQ